MSIPSAEIYHLPVICINVREAYQVVSVTLCGEWVYHMCSLMTPGHQYGAFGVMYDHDFSKLEITRCRHQATHESGLSA